MGSLYEAAACPDRWQDFLQLTVEQFAAERAGLTLHTDQNTAATIHSIGFPLEAVREYNSYYGARNPLVEPYSQLVAKTGTWYGLARSVVGEREYRATEYYNDFGRKYGSYWVVNALVATSAHEVATLSVVRSEAANPLDHQAVDLMGLLTPHLSRIFRIRHAMESLRSTAAAAVSALDAFEAAIVAVNGKGQVLMTNGKAEDILREQDGLLLRGKQLAAKEPQETRELDALVRSAAATGAGRGLHPGGAMLLSRRKRRALRVSVIPFHSSHIFTESAPCALIFLQDPEALPASRALALSSLYRLTPAECRLTDLLLQGLEVAAAATRMCITAGTARFMLKTILAKTGTHRQSELMRTLMSLPHFAIAR
jgi:DNA-binding CsgD family transcriptional regulator/PAS domain-containing protein